LKVRFIGLNSILYPYTRVRCFNFAETLEKNEIPCEVFALSERYLKDPSDKFLDAGDRKKLSVQWKLYRDLHGLNRQDIFYFQKVHHHIAVPYFLARRKRIPYVVDYDDWDFDRSPFFYRSSLNRLFFGSNTSESITENVVRHASLCIASSHRLQKKLEAIQPNTVLIPTGVDMKAFDGEKLACREPGPVFLWSGDVWGDLIIENLIFILSSLNLMWCQYANWKLILAVFGEKVPLLRRIIQTSFGHLPVEIYEKVPPDKMPEIYAKANIGLMPLFTDEANLPWVESKSPTKLFEYMAMKMIPVCQSIGEAPCILEHRKNGFLFRDQKDFLEILRYLLDEYWKLNHVRESAFETVYDNYRLEILGDNLSSTLERNFPWLIK